MLPFEQLSQIPGLSPATGVLVATKVAVAPGDWPRLTACAQHARTLGVPRQELEETLLQAILFFGFPRVVTAFATLEQAWSSPAPPRGGSLAEDQQAAAGAALFDRIYGDNAETVHAMLRNYHGELHDFVLEAAYGRVLARPGLAPRARELLAVAALAALDQPPQLIAHGRGALAFGATAEQVDGCLCIAGVAPAQRARYLSAIEKRGGA